MLHNLDVMMDIVHVMVAKV